MVSRGSSLKFPGGDDAEGMGAVQDSADLIGAVQHDGQEMSPISTGASHAFRQILLSGEE